MMSAPFDRYAEAHVSPSGEGDARPTGQQVIDDEGLRGAWKDKTLLVTGCSAGLGLETVRVLATTGAKIYMAIRDIARGEATRKSLLEENTALNPDNLVLVVIDLASLSSVRRGADEIKVDTKTLNVLINNAGLAMPPKATTADGFDLSFQTNHLGHFLLFKLLEPLLLASSTPKFQSRVVNVSSLAHRLSTVLLSDYNFEKTEYSPYAAYGQSKTANIWMTNEIERRCGSHGIHGISVHPGRILTGVIDAQPAEARARMEAMIKIPEVAKTMKNVRQGTATIVVAAACKHFEGAGGVFLEDCTEATPVRADAPVAAPGYAPWAFDEQGAQQLWLDSIRFVQSYL